MTYLLGKRSAEGCSGSTAALALALTYAHVVTGQWVKEDVPAGFFHTAGTVLLVGGDHEGPDQGLGVQRVPRRSRDGDEVLLRRPSDPGRVRAPVPREGSRSAHREARRAARDVPARSSSPASSSGPRSTSCGRTSSMQQVMPALKRAGAARRPRVRGDRRPAGEPLRVRRSRWQVLDRRHLCRRWSRACTSPMGSGSCSSSSRWEASCWRSSVTRASTSSCSSRSWARPCSSRSATVSSRSRDTWSCSTRCWRSGSRRPRCS